MHPEFDAVADGYDDGFSNTAVGTAMRRRVRSLIPPVKPDFRALELNCGTGEDALWLAQQGAMVVATDISPVMIEVVNTKISKAGYQARVTAQVCGFDDLSALSETGFELVFSNFGGLNCIPPESLAALSKALDEKTAPGARLMLVVMSRFCWWETAYFLLKGRWREAFRRFSRKPVAARLDQVTTIQTWYYAPAGLIALFPEFKVESCHPAGFWLPPSYLNPFFAKKTRLLKMLEWLEQHATLRWLARWSDHYVVLLRKA